MSCQWYSVCPLRNLEKQGKISDKWKTKYCKTKNNWKNCKRYKLEQKGKTHPDNMMPDGSIVKID